MSDFWMPGLVQNRSTEYIRKFACPQGRQDARLIYACQVFHTGNEIFREEGQFHNNVPSCRLSLPGSYRQAGKNDTLDPACKNPAVNNI